MKILINQCLKIIIKKLNKTSSVHGKLIQTQQQQHEPFYGIKLLLVVQGLFL